MSDFKTMKSNADYHYKEIITITSDEEDDGKFVVVLEDDADKDQADVQIMASYSPWRRNSIRPRALSPCNRKIKKPIFAKDCVITISSSDEDDCPVNEKWRRRHRVIKSASKNKLRKMGQPCNDENSMNVVEGHLDIKRSYLDVFRTDPGEPGVKLAKFHQTKVKNNKHSKSSSNIFDIINSERSKSQESFDEAKVANDLGHVMFLDDPLVPVEEVVISNDSLHDGIDDISQSILNISVDSAGAFDSQPLANNKPVASPSALLVNSPWFPDSDSLSSLSLVDDVAQLTDSQSLPARMSQTVCEPLDRSSGGVVAALCFPDDKSLDTRSVVNCKFQSLVDSETMNSQPVVATKLPKLHVRLDTVNCKSLVSKEWFPDDESLDSDSFINKDTQELPSKADDSSLHHDSIDWQPLVKLPLSALESIHKTPLSPLKLDEAKLVHHGVQNIIPAVLEKSTTSASKKSSRCRNLSYLKSPPACHTQLHPLSSSSHLVQVYRDNLITLVEAFIDEGEAFIPLAMTQIEAFTTRITRPSLTHVEYLMGWLVRPQSIQVMKQALILLLHINELHGFPLQLQLWEYVDLAYNVDLVNPSKMRPLIKSTVFNLVCCILETELSNLDGSKEKFTLSHAYRLISVEAAFGNVKTLIAWLEDSIKLYLDDRTCELAPEDRHHVYSLITSIQRLLGISVEMSKKNEVVQRLGNELLIAHNRLLVPEQQHLLLRTLNSDAVMVFVCEQIIHRIASPPDKVGNITQDDPCSMEKIVQFYFKFSPIVTRERDQSLAVENFVILLGLLQLTQLAKHKGKQAATNNLNKDVTDCPMMCEEEADVLKDYDVKITKLQNRLASLYPETSKSSSINCHFLNLRLELMMIN